MSQVIHLLSALEVGGAQRNTLETCARLHEPRRRQRLLSGNGPLASEAKQRLGDRLCLVEGLANDASFAQTLGAISQVRRLLQAETRTGTALIHTHSTKAGFVGRIAAAGLPRVPVVHTVHGFGHDAFGPQWHEAIRGLERLAAPFADRYVFVSEADLEEAVLAGLAPARRARLIRSGVDDQAFSTVRTEDKSAARRTLKVPNAAGPIIVTAANFKRQKDPLFHLRIFDAVARVAPGAHYFYLGDGPLRAEFTREASRQGLTDRITLPGICEDIRPYLAIADVVLLASAWEGLPRTVLEATAAGLPVVVRDTGWASDVAFAKNVVALPPDATAEAFASTLLRRRFPKAPRRLPPPFTLQGMLDELSALYDELLGSSEPVVSVRSPGRLDRRPRR